MTTTHTHCARLTTALALAGAALVVPTLSVPAEATPATEDGASVKTVNRAYGGKVVQSSPEQRLRIRFRGDKGDLVALRSFPDVQDPTCETAVLRHLDSGRKVVQLNAALWRLPAGKRYVVSYRHECFRNDANDAQPEDLRMRMGIFVSKVVTHELVPGGPGIDLPVERRHLHAAVLTLRDPRAVRVEAASQSPYGEWERLLVPPSMQRRAGAARTFDGWPCSSWSPVVVRAGWGIAHTPPAEGGGTAQTEISCDEEARGYVPAVGESVWFVNPRLSTVATAAYGN